ncbi:UDP-N-acetylmuramoyl-L-alanine--D-glutamate ligase [Desulfonatronospira sp.]|uniref:UDP-N-acetylmuramoyl-L-alanine--D-glutamate ligase n=1 Tax=Desulfonatronospira sp. TaxID=1962951 RepID=UPI0025C3BF58|nr:UDP-N-acetylmuramoyl-L-alanine--D-glutamate ligase [Desulfonatronospira sp.]
MQEMVHKDQLKGHKAVVVGAGRSGLSAAALLAGLGAGVRLLEKRTDFDASLLESRGLSEVQLVLGEHRQEHFKDVDLVVVSPGISLSMVKDLCPGGRTVISELELASWFISEPVIAVTGTNGKTTTCMLIQKVLEKAGRRVFTGGNIGTPLSDHVLSGARADMLVLEVSSFQLQGCSGFAPHVGVLLNFSANHLDHHKSEDEYFQAKMQLFARQSSMDLAVLPLELRGKIEGDFRIKSNIPYFAPTGRFDCPALPGTHNQANMEAAMLACGFLDVSRKTFDQTLLEFVPPPHRQEVFLQDKGVTYINDSKATTLEALAAAIQAFDAPIRLLAGGKYKGGDFSLLARTLQEKAAKVYLFGHSREIFENAWKDSVKLEYFPDLEQAAARAVQEADFGDNVLLSPGTSSFDLFNNYQERGEAFKEKVKQETGMKIQ